MRTAIGNSAAHLSRQTLNGVLRATAIVPALKPTLLLMLALTGLGCGELTLSQEGTRTRSYPAAAYDDAFRATSRVLADRFGTILRSDREAGTITTNSRRYNPAGLGPTELGRFTNPSGYQSRAEARLERLPDGTRVNIRVVVERYEYDKRALVGGLGPTDDILYDDRRPNTPLQESLYAGQARGGRWQQYRTDQVMSEELLRDVERLLAGKPLGPADPTLARPGGAPTVESPKPSEPAKPGEPAKTTESAPTEPKTELKPPPPAAPEPPAPRPSER